MVTKLSNFSIRFFDPKEYLFNLNGFVMLVQQCNNGLTAGDMIPLLPGLNLIPCILAGWLVCIEAGRDTPFAQRSALFSPQVSP